MKLTKRSLIYIMGGALITIGVGAWVVQKVTSELELDQVQQARLEAVKDEFLDMRTDMRSDREQTRADVLTMFEQSTFDRDKANAIVAQYVDKVNTRSPQIIDAIGDFYDSLNDEQRTELNGFIRHKMEHHHRWYH